MSSSGVQWGVIESVKMKFLRAVEKGNDAKSNIIMAYNRSDFI